MQGEKRRAIQVGGMVGLLLASLSAPIAPASAQGPVVTQGAEVMNVPAWHAAGLRGQGVKVAVWDSGFYEFDTLLGVELPPTQRLIARGFGIPIAGDPEEIAQDPDGPRHGTAVAEIVYDIAPEATLYLMAANDGADEIAGLEWLMSEGVDVVVASISLSATGCLDVSENPIEAVFAQMRQQGMLLVTASGNDRLAHWQGAFSDSDGNGQQDFTPSDNTITFEGFEDDPIDLLLSWDDPCRPSDNDFDLFVFDDNGEIVASSEEDNAQTAAQESVSDVLPADGTYHIVIEAFSATPDVTLDLVWVNGPELEHAVIEQSVSFFEPAISPNALTVGAVNWKTLQQEDTSSQGPTKDGRSKPELAAPTCVQTVSYGVGPELFDPEECGFSGTSAAAPHAAGAAVLVAQAHPEFTPEQIQRFLEQNARDLGPAGRDNAFGFGLIQLPPPGQTQARSIAEAIAGSDGRISDTEIKDAARYWVTDSPVPGTGGQTIGDVEMAALVQAWVTGEVMLS